jgi:hypothetical protein
MNAHTAIAAPEQSDEAHEAARAAAFQEFIEWQRADYDRREFEDFGNWLANKASWNRPNHYEAALTYAERPRLTDPELVALSRNHKRFNREMGRGL